MDVLVEAQGVSKVFRSARGGDVTAIERLDLAVADGEFVSVLGPSGCGKSTLLFMIAGFEAPTGGRLTVGGEPVTRPGPDRGVVFQEYALFPWLTVLDNVAYGLREQGMHRRERERDRAALRRAGRARRLRRPPSARAVGRDAPARGARARARHPAAHLVDGRALRRARRADALPPAGVAPRHLGEREQDRRVRHAQHRGGRVPERPRGGDDRAARAASRTIVAVDLPRPRDRTSEDFNHIRRRLAQAIQDEVLAAQRDWGSPA